MRRFRWSGAAVLAVVVLVVAVTVLVVRGGGGSEDLVVSGGVQGGDADSAGPTSEAVAPSPSPTLEAVVPTAEPVVPTAVATAEAEGTVGPSPSPTAEAEGTVVPSPSPTVEAVAPTVVVTAVPVGPSPSPTAEAAVPTAVATAVPVAAKPGPDSLDTSSGGGRTFSEEDPDPLDDEFAPQEGDDLLDRRWVPGPVYEWFDGDRVRRAQLQLDLAVRLDGVLEASDTVVDDTGAGTIVQVPVPASAPGAGDAAGQVPRAGPVFVSESGELMSLPGGVLAVLDAGWSLEQVQAFFAGHGVDWDGVSELAYADNGYLVATEPGFASLELANTLAAQPGVETSSPNWWTEHTRK